MGGSRKKHSKGKLYVEDEAKLAIKESKARKLDKGYVMALPVQLDEEDDTEFVGSENTATLEKSPTVTEKDLEMFKKIREASNSSDDEKLKTPMGELEDKNEEADISLCQTPTREKGEIAEVMRSNDATVTDEDKAPKIKQNHQEMENFPSLPTGAHHKTSRVNRVESGTDTIRRKASQNKAVNAWTKPKNSGFLASPVCEWEDIFTTKGKSDLFFDKEFNVQIVDGERLVADLPDEVYEEGERQWRSCVVGQFIGPPPPYSMISYMVSIAWRRLGRTEISYLGKGLYLFKLEKEEYAEKVLNQLWHVNSIPMLLRRWEPDIKYRNIQSRKAPIWVKLWNVPLSLWTKEGLGYIGAFIGRPLQLDTAT